MRQEASVADCQNLGDSAKTAYDGERTTGPADYASLGAKTIASGQNHMSRWLEVILKHYFGALGDRPR